MNYTRQDEELFKKYPYFERILDEKFDLDKKINSLNDFLKSDKTKLLDNTEKEYLEEQLLVMNKYTEILSKRIEYIRSK